jgi:hypothetical protein
VSVHLVKRFQRITILEIGQSENNNCLWRSCLLTDREKMCNLYKGPSINASYQVSVHLTKGIQRRRLKCEKLTDDRDDDRRRMQSDGKSLTCFWQIELKPCVFSVLAPHVNKQVPCHCTKPGQWAIMYLCVRDYRFLLFLRFYYLILILFRLCGMIKK